MENAGSAAMPRLTCALKSAKRPLLSKLSPLWVAAALCASLIGCGNSPDHAAGIDPGDAGIVEPIPTGNACDTPNDGCACATADETVDCGRVERTSGSYVSCSMGQRTCTDGKWGACIGDRVATLNLATGLQRTQNLGTGMDCMDNPCDPYCRVVVDDPNGLPLPDGGALINDGGLQVVPHEDTGTGGLCTSMKVKPTPQTLTVNGFQPGTLTADYFNQIDKTVSQIPATWTPIATLAAQNINLNSSSGLSGVAALSDNSYSIRWTGKIIAATTESYTLCAAADDGVRLWIDGTLIIDSWIDQNASHCASPISWTAGSKHDIRYDFYQGFGGAVAILSWSTPTIPQQVVPASAFTGSGTSQVSTSNTVQFAVDVLPAGCLSVTPTPAWTLDHLDIATIGTDGTVNLISGVAGPINVTAYLGQLSASGVVNVVVNIANTDSAPAGSVAGFQAAVTGTDPAKVLYPYDQTVMPIGLRAPLIQWDNGGTAASAVEITLQYPATGTATFTWSEIIPESATPQAAMPRDVWKYFEQTAKGQAGSITLQRLIGGQPRPAIKRTVNFSSTPIRGKIYYTQYHRGIDANEMQADPGSENPAQPAFGSTDGCPVCHTLSASGNVFATSSRVGITPTGGSQTFSATLGGISSVNANGTLSPIADFVPDPTRANYTGGTKDWRGFAWAPLTPDGKYALTANNIWGNTTDQVVGINTGTRQVNTGNTMLSGAPGTGLLAQYYPSTNYTGTVWKRFEPQVNFDFGAGSPGGLITANYSVKRTGQIAAFFSETYKFEVVSSSTDAFSLTVGGTTVTGTAPATLIANVPMTAGSLVPFELDDVNAAGNSNVQLYWSSPSTPRALVPQSQLFPPAGEPLHGATVVYRDDATGTSVSRLEPDIASDFVDHNPAAGIAPDNWKSTWDAQIESPYGGAMKLCVDSDDAVTVTLDGAVLNSLTSGGGVTSNCSTEAINWTVGSKHTVHIAHHEDGGNAHIILKYQYGGFTEVIPSANLTPPVGYTQPTSGLTATYYDIDAFNVALAGTNNQTNPRAFQRIDPNIDFDWGSGRPNYSVISADDTFSARWTGKINLACAGVYEFRSNGNVDDGGRLWIDDTRVMSRWNVAAGPLIGAGYFDPGLHDFKFDYYENTGGATVQLQWKTPCAGSTWVTVPSTVFTPAPYTRATGSVVDGGDNGNNTSYWVWQTPTSAAPTPIDVTAAHNGNWGIEGQALMVPSFSPDGTKLVFIDGDSGGGAGWRKGVSTYDFDETAQLFKNRRLIANNWPLGDALKWPAFESDSRSVIFQSTVPGDSCCRNNWTKYGYMGPTNYYEDPGRLWSVDSQATPPAPVALTKLNSGERPQDTNKSYQPTMLPVAAGGYRWVVFTSTRPYGNTLNLPAIQQDFSNTASYASSSYTAITNYSDIQSQLWVSAIDDTVSGAADRSHPGFWLPNQNYASDASSGYVNERGFWALDACHPPGTTSASTCEVDDDCCGGTGTGKTAACRLDTPLSAPPTRHCQALPAVGSCVAAAGSCGAASDCCTGLVCVNAACQTPPPVLVVDNVNYERIYQSDCPDGTKVVWRFFDWMAVTPATNSKLEVFAETEADPTTFSTLAAAPTAITAPGVLKLADITTSNPTSWIGSAVSLALDGASLKSQQYLKITVRFWPNIEHTLSPILKDWRQSYSCVPAE